MRLACSAYGIAATIGWDRMEVGPVSIQYYLVPNPLTPGMLRAVPLPGDRAAFDAFLDHCKVASTVGRADALAVVEMMAGWIEHHAGYGREVDFGPLGQTRLGMSGIFEPGEESIWPDEWRLTIGWRVSRRLQERVDRRAKKAGLGRRPRPNRGPHVAAVTGVGRFTWNCWARQTGKSFLLSVASYWGENRGCG